MEHFNKVRGGFFKGELAGVEVELNPIGISGSNPVRQVYGEKSSFHGRQVILDWTDGKVIKVLGIELGPATTVVIGGKI